VAAGATVNYGKAKLTRGVLAVGDEFEFKGDGVAYGYNAGIMWNPHRMHHFGLTYRSATRIDFSGHSKLHTDPFTAATPFGPFVVPGIDRREDANASFDLPQNIVFGYSFRPTADWNFEFNLDWTDWDSLNTVTLHQPSGDVALPFNWQSSFFYEFGVTKKFDHGFQASLGYIYSENSVPNASFSPAIPDSIRHIFSAGVGQRYEHINWNLAYQYSYGPSRTVNQGSIADGTYRFDSHAVTLTLGYNF
jgi:long-chain fatty acid transport protein